MSKKLYSVALFAVPLMVLAVGGCASKPTANPATPPASTSINSQKPASATVEYTDAGFSPQSTTIKAGETVKFINKNSGDMLVASAPHPAHTDYDGTAMSQHCAPGATPSFDSCVAVKNGDSYSFTFDKTGTWKFHNHLDPTKFGSITVQ